MKIDSLDRGKPNETQSCYVKDFSQKKLSIVIAVLLVLLSFAPLALLVRSVGIKSVSDYVITEVVQTNPSTITVTVQCTFCGSCNPNPAGNSGCTPFSVACGFPPSYYPSYSSFPCAAGCPDGRFAAVQLVSATLGVITQKLVCTPSNWPIGSPQSHSFVFSGLTLAPGETVHIYADFYCSWCGHWWAVPQTIVPDIGHGYFIIVAGNYYGSLLGIINDGCNHVYNILLDKGFTGDQIYYLNQPEYNPQDGDGNNDIDALATSANIQAAIGTWAAARVSPTQPLYMYMFDHGGVNEFCVDSPDQLAPAQLTTWLNNLETATGSPTRIIYAACHSGSFIDELSRTGRVITTSCRADQYSYVGPGGHWEAFSEPFWNQIHSGHSIAWSFNIACMTVASQGYPQTPLLDDNGDGIGNTGSLPNGGDGILAGNVYIGACEWPFPWISYAVKKQFFTWPPPPNVLLWAEIENTTALAEVVAYLRPPNWTDTPSDNYTMIDPGFEGFQMTDPDHDGNFTASIAASSFTKHANGTSDFKFIICAEQTNGETAIPATTGVQFTPTGQPPLDGTLPIVRVERPLDGRYVSGTIKINGTAADDVCVKRVEFYVGGNMIGSSSLPQASTSYFEQYFDTSTVQNGLRTIVVKAFDTSENTALKEYEVKVDNPYSVTISAYCYKEGHSISVNIAKDYTPTAYQTTHTFDNLTGSRTFSVNSTDAEGHTFNRWNTGEGSVTIAVDRNGTYVANYDVPVGGVVLSVDKIALFLPHIACASSLVAGVAIVSALGKRRFRHRNKN